MVEIRIYDEVGRDKIRDFLSDCDNVYDIGAGFNKITNIAKTIDFDSKTNPDIHDDFGHEDFEIPSCQGVCMSHSLEHCENTIVVLSTIYSCLEDGGRIAITVPDGEDTCSKTLGDASYGHRQLFTPKTLKIFLEYCGFKDVHSEYYDRPTAWKQTKGIFARGIKWKE